MRTVVPFIERFLPADGSGAELIAFAELQLLLEPLRLSGVLLHYGLYLSLRGPVVRPLGERWKRTLDAALFAHKRPFRAHHGGSPAHGARRPLQVQPQRVGRPALARRRAGDRARLAVAR